MCICKFVDSVDRWSTPGSCFFVGDNLCGEEIVHDGKFSAGAEYRLIAHYGCEIMPTKSVHKEYGCNVLEIMIMIRK